jgi:beta-glucuronidase
LSTTPHRTARSCVFHAVIATASHITPIGNRRHATAVALALVVLGLLALPSAAEAQRLKTGQTIRVTRADYKPDPGAVGLGRGWQRPGEAKGWRRVGIPHTFSRRARGPYPGGTVGWYRFRLSAPGGNANFRADFEQLRRRSTFWLNGRRIGAHSEAYAPKHLSLRGLRRGGNTLIVRVDSRKGRNPIEGWWNWGGMVRPMHIASVGSLAATGLHVTGNISGGQPALVGHALLHNRSRSTIADPILSVGLQGAAATPVRSGPLGPNRRRRVSFNIPVDGVQAWSPQSPALYNVVVQTQVGGQPHETVRERTGFRSISVEGGKLVLNGLPLNMRGYSIHEDLPGRGAALRDGDINRIAGNVRASGANVVRSHYALNERLLDRFDQMGILVYNQAPIYQRTTQLQSPGRRIQAMREVRGSVERGFSHPSVIVNTVANELAPGPNGNPGVQRFLLQANRTVRAQDPTRPVGVDLRSLPNIGPQRAYAVYDVLGFNQYFGWYGGRPGRSLQFLDDLVAFLREQRAIYPTQAIVVSEFGAEATQSGSELLKGTYQFQSRYLAANLDIMNGEPYLSGIIYWTLREFQFRPGWIGGSQVKPGRRDAIHNKGVISYRTGRAKPAYYVARDRFLATPLYGP